MEIQTLQDYELFLLQLLEHEESPEERFFLMSELAALKADEIRTEA